MHNHIFCFFAGEEASSPANFKKCSKRIFFCFYVKIWEVYWDLLRCETTFSIKATKSSLVFWLQRAFTKNDHIKLYYAFLRKVLKGTPASASDSALLRSLRFISLTSKSLSGSAKVKKDHHIFLIWRNTQKKTFQHIQWYPILALIFCPFLTNFDANFSKLHLCVILKVSQKTLKIDKKSLLNPMDFTIFDP